MDVMNIMDFPYTEYGNDPKRKLRMIMSPYTNGVGDVTIVHVTIPPGGVSEGHIHEDCDEIIYFDIGGRTIIDGQEYDVEKNNLVFAPKGKKHECVNTSTTSELSLLCIFIPAFKPYGPYPELIEKTRGYLEDK